MSKPSTRLRDTPQARRAANEQAVKLAVAGRWEEAAALNRQLIASFGDDAEVYNRLGKALTELGKIRQARTVYRKALAADPTNAIAQRNLDRLAQAKKGDAPEPAAQMSRGLFIEEVGEAAVVRLEAERADALSALDAGDAVELEARGDAVNALTPAGDYLGMVEPRVGLRLARLMGGGNRYSAALVSAAAPPRIIVRETYRDPSQAGKVSFPKSSISEVRAYTRRDFRREDVDDLTGDDDALEERSEGPRDLPEGGHRGLRIDDVESEDGGASLDEDRENADDYDGDDELD